MPLRSVDFVNLITRRRTPPGSFGLILRLCGRCGLALHIGHAPADLSLATHADSRACSYRLVWGFAESCSIHGGLSSRGHVGTLLWLGEGKVLGLLLGVL